MSEEPEFRNRTLLDEPITEATIFQSVWAIIEGSHDPEQPRRLLAEFVRLEREGVSRDNPVFNKLIRYLSDATAKYLADKPEPTGEFERILGLTRRRGRPSNPDRDITIAQFVLRQRISGTREEDALRQAEKKYHLSTIDKLWDTNK
jgi:hypothetical protein